MEVFAALGTQWRLAPMGGVIGLDYAALMPTLRLLGVARANWREVFADVQVMERAAVQAMRA